MESGLDGMRRLKWYPHRGMFHHIAQHYPFLSTSDNMPTHYTINRILCSRCPAIHIGVPSTGVNDGEAFSTPPSERSRAGVASNVNLRRDFRVRKNVAPRQLWGVLVRFECSILHWIALLDAFILIMQRVPQWLK